jgi:hypothetical protein
MSGNIVTIQKTITADAVQINSPEEDAVVRSWLTEMFEQGIEGISRQEAEELSRAQELAPVIEAGAYFARDVGSVVVYIITPEEFSSAYEVQGTREAPYVPQSAFIIKE